MPKSKPTSSAKKRTNSSKSLKTKTTTKVNLKANQVASSSSQNRKLRAPKRWQRFSRGEKIQHPALPSAFKIFNLSLKILKEHWKLFALLILTYGLLNIILVRGLSDGSSLGDIKSTLQQAFKGSGGQFWTSLSLFIFLFGNAGSNGNADAGLYQTLLIIIISLAIIWILRQLYNNAKIRMRDGLYKGMYPLIPFILVLLVIGLQLIPLLIGGLIYSTVISNGIAVYFVEKILWGGLFLLLALLSLYMLCSSVFALYIVTLPDMSPMKALRSARQLVRFRRWLILRKMLFLPLILLILAIIIMLPLILFITPVAAWAYFVLTLIGLVVIHSYMYALYRELLE